MNRPKNTISRKIELLNKATIYPILETNKVKIIENFTNTALNILEADFGFAWLKVEENKEYKLAYKSPNIPFPPMIPKRKNHEDKKLKKWHKLEREAKHIQDRNKIEKSMQCCTAD